MAGWKQVMDGALREIQAVVPAFQPPVHAGIDWPTREALDQVGQTGRPIIALVDRQMARNSTRWMPVSIRQVLGVATVTLTRAPVLDEIPAGGSIDVTVGGTVGPNDAAALVLSNPVPLPGTLTTLGFGPKTAAAVAVNGTSAGSTAAIAAALVAKVQADPDLSAWLTASVVGSVVTLTNRLANVLRLACNVGNVRTDTREVGRWERHIQATCWARKQDDLERLTTPIEARLFQLQADFGYQNTDDTFVRLAVTGDVRHLEALLSDVYRRDLLFCIDYPITVTDIAYSVLAPIPEFAVFTPDQPIVP